MMFGAFRNPSSVNNPNASCWDTICAVGDEDGTMSISGLGPGGVGNAVRYRMPLDSAAFTTDATTLVPAAVTVQIMNPEALQTTSGIVYAGVMNTQAKIGGRTESWHDYFGRFVEFQAPRLMAAGKLALRGVQISSYPLSMSQVSEFTAIRGAGDTDEDTYAFSQDHAQPEGWAPIMVYNPNGIALQYLVTIEYRIRFDLTNPASGAHRHHPMHSDQQWAKLMQQATAMGHGVLDIADLVSRAGSYLRPLADAAKAI